MPKYYSEETIYKKVGTSDFSKLTPAQLESFVSILHKISPDMVARLMNRFSDYRMSANRMVGILRMKVLNNRKLKRKKQRELRQKCMDLLQELDQALSRQEITETDTDFINDHLIMLACLLKANNNPEQARKALKILALVTAGVVIIGGALFLLAALVSDTDKQNRDDSNADNGDGSDSDDANEYPELTDEFLEEWHCCDDEFYYDNLEKFIPESERNNPCYDPFTDPDNPLYEGEFIEIDDEFDDEEIEGDESYAAEEYLSSRPWGYDNDGYWGSDS